MEKPDRERAEALPRLRGVLLEQRHVYVPRQKYLIELAKYRPDILETCRAAVNAADNGSDFINIPHDIFCECPDESVDYAVMEKPLMRWWSVSMLTGATLALVRTMGGQPERRAGQRP